MHDILIANKTEGAVKLNYLAMKCFTARGFALRTARRWSDPAWVTCSLLLFTTVNMLQNNIIITIVTAIVIRVCFRERVTSKNIDSFAMSVVPNVLPDVQPV